MQEKLRVLIVEDSEADTFLIVRQLQEGGFEVEAQRVESEAAMAEALRLQIWDLIISDYAMPQFSGPMALTVRRQSSSEAPFFLVSGVVGEHIAVEMLKAGAHYYLKKDELRRLVPAVRRELAAAEERRIQQQTEATAAYLASLVQSCEEAIIGMTLEGKIVSWNGGAERLYGQSASTMLGRPFACLLPRYRPEDLKDMLDRIKSGSRVEEFETLHVFEGRSPIEVLVTFSAVRNLEGRVIGASTVVKDISQRKAEEAERLALIQDLSRALGTVNTITGAN